MTLHQRRTFLRLCARGAVALTAGCAIDRTPIASPHAPAASPVSLATSALPPVVARDEAADATATHPAESDPVWAREWQDLVSAAQGEGRFSLLTWVGRGYRRAVEAFERSFPGIRVEHVEESSADVWLGRVRRERRAGTYAFDIGLVHTDRALKDGAPDGMWAPLGPLLIHPEVLDDGAWRDGFTGRFVDAAGDLCFGWSYSVFHCYAIDLALVAEGEITSVRDLLDPRWRGKILTGDPRLGVGLLSAASAARTWGSSILKPLLVDQRPVIVNGGPEAVAEPLARGRYPIALGVRPKALEPLREQGIGLQVRYLDLPDADFVPTGSLLYFDRAPHPAAARLFANWILTRQGQAILAGNLQTNSARTDLAAFQPDDIGRPGGAYYEPDREASYAHTAVTQEHIRRLLNARP